jgi:hypothetical protein
MPLTIENAGALVPGVILKEGKVETQKVKVLRGFYDGKTVLKPGDILNLPELLARQAKDGGKVEFLLNDPPPVKVEPPKVEKKAVALVGDSEKAEEVKTEEKHKKYGKD